jgi:acyl dehydratase
MDLDELRALPGTSIPPGHYRIPGYESRLLDEIVHAEPGRPEPHPVYGFIVPQLGMGLSIEDLLEFFGSSGEQGPMLGSCTVEYHAPLAIGEDYYVSGEVIAAERKSGRTLGTFDSVTYCLQARTADAALTVTATNTFLLPRSEP